MKPAHFNIEFKGSFNSFDSRVFARGCLKVGGAFFINNVFFLKVRMCLRNEMK